MAGQSPRPAQRTATGQYVSEIFLNTADMFHQVSVMLTSLSTGNREIEAADVGIESVTPGRVTFSLQRRSATVHQGT